MSKIKVLVRDVSWTNVYVPGSLTISRRVNAIGSARLTFFPESLLGEGSFPQFGELLTILDEDRGDTVLFKGTIKRVRVEVISEIGSAAIQQSLEIEAQDFNAIANRFFVADRWSETTVGDIVRQIVNSTTRMSEEGITVGEVADGPVMAEVRFSYVTAAEAFDKLARMFGWVWFITDTKVLHFHPRSELPAPHAFVGGNRSFRSIARTIHGDGYRNRQYLRAGKGRTDEITEILPGKSDEDDYRLRYELAEAPRVLVDTGSGYVESTKIGIQGVDDVEAKTGGNYDIEWLYKVEDDTLRRNPNLSNLSGSDSVKVIYTGLFPLIVIADNPQQQTLMAARAEGGTGIFEAKDDEESIDGIDLADARATGFLDEGDQETDTIQIRTELHGWIPGQFVDVGEAAVAAYGRYMLETVTLTDLGAIPGHTHAFVYELDMISQTALSRDWEFWQKVIATGREFRLRENEKLLVLRKTVDQLAPVDALLPLDEPESGDQLVGWDTDGYSVFIVGLSQIGALVGTPEEIP